MTHMPDLITKRLTVRPFRMDDVGAYLRVFADGDAPGEENQPPEWSACVSRATSSGPWVSCRV